MQEAVPAGHGAMAAVLGLDDDAVCALCAQAAQGEVLEPVSFNAPAQVVIAGTAAAVDATAAEPGAIREALVRQIASPVRWVETIANMAQMQVRAFVECGPSNVLTTLNKRIARGADCLSVHDPASLAQALDRTGGPA